MALQDREGLINSIVSYSLAGKVRRSWYIVVGESLFAINSGLYAACRLTVTLSAKQNTPSVSFLGFALRILPESLIANCLTTIQSSNL